MMLRSATTDVLLTRPACALCPWVYFDVQILRTWDARTNACTNTTRLKGDIMDMSLAGNGHTLYVATGKALAVWDVRNMAQVCTYTGKAKVGLIQAFGSDAVATTSMNKIVMYYVHAPTDREEDQRPPTVLSPPHYDKVLSLGTCGAHLFSGCVRCLLALFCPVRV